MFSRLLTLIIKELITLLRDKQTRMILIMPVILQIVLFPAAATLEVKNASIAIYNQDNGQASSEIIQRLGRSKAFSDMLLLNSNQEIAPTINNEKALLFIQFPANFSRDLLNGQQTQLQLILDGRHSNSAQIAANYVQQIILQYQSEVMHTQLPAQLIIRNWYNPNLDYKWFVVPSLVALIATISILIVTSLSIAREREQGTMEQLLVSPLTIPQIFIGKAIPALIVSCLQATIVLLAGIFVYHISFQGSLLLFYFCLLIYGLSLVGFGLLISSFCNTQQQSFIGVMVFTIPMILLSGYVSPVENMPVWLQHITWINPIRHFTNITKMIYLKNADFIAVWQSLWPLLVIAVITITIAYWLFKRKIA